MQTGGTMGETETGTFPLRIGTADEFRRVADALRAAGYDDATLCRRFDLGDMSDIGRIDIGPPDYARIGEPLATLIRLFLQVEHVPRADAEKVFDRNTLDAFIALDLLRAEADATAYYTPVFLYPVAGFAIASDLYMNPTGGQFTPPADVVFPALTSHTLQFLRLISERPAEAALDLCAGSGIGALVLSRHSERAVSSDITRRATHFAHFNRLLNNRKGVEAVCGDLYDSVLGQTFDRIIAHPPYVPAPRTTAIWRDGGETGEVLVQRIIEGAPRALRPGGLLYNLSLGIDTREALFEERVRGWLGAAESEFDIIFAVHHETSTQKVIKGVLEKNEALGAADISRLERAFKEIGTTNLAVGALVMRRREAGDGREPWTFRTTLSPETDGSSFDQAFRWHDRAAAPGFIEELLAGKPRLSPRLRVTVTHTVEAGRLTPTEFIVESQRPFASKLQFDHWIVPIMTGFDGEITVATQYESARDASAIPAQFDRSDFAALTSLWIERGFLEFD